MALKFPILFIEGGVNFCMAALYGRYIKNEWYKAVFRKNHNNSMQIVIFF